MRLLYDRIAPNNDTYPSSADIDNWRKSFTVSSIPIQDVIIITSILQNCEGPKTEELKTSVVLTI